MEKNYRAQMEKQGVNTEGRRKSRDGHETRSDRWFSDLHGTKGPTIHSIHGVPNPLVRCSWGS